MVFTVKDFNSQQVFPGTQLLAGEQGLSREIHWINLMEILDRPQSIQPGELLFTTGSGLRNMDAHQNLISQLSGRNVSGLVIQLGYYLDSVPQYLIEQANQYDFPLLTISPDITFSDILHTMMRILASSDSLQVWSNSIVTAACNFLNAEVSRIGNPFFPLTDHTAVHLLFLEPVNYSNISQDQWDTYMTQLRSFIQSNSCAYSWCELPQCKHVFLISTQEYNYTHILYTINIKLTLLSEKFGANCYLGAETLHDPKDVYEALSHTADCLNTLRLVRARRGVCHYQHIWFIKLLGQLHRQDNSAVLENHRLQALFHYDTVNSTNYVQTLRFFLANNCNINQTAAQTFIHRHTLLKRLAKISEVGEMDINDYYTRVHLSIALLFHDYFVY